MRIKKEEIPVTMQAPGTIMRGLPGWGGMTVAFNEIPGYRYVSLVTRIKK